MRKQLFIALFIGAHLAFVGFQIDKQTKLAKLSYIKQSHDQKVKVLAARKQELINQLHALQNHQKIKSFAQNQLGMQPLFLKNLKRLPKKEMPVHEHHQ